MIHSRFSEATLLYGIVLLACAGCSSEDLSGLESDQNQVLPPREPAGLVIDGYRLVKVLVDIGVDSHIDEVYQLQYDQTGLSVGELIDSNGDGEFEHSFTYIYRNDLLVGSDYDQSNDGTVDTKRSFIYDDEGMLQTVLVDVLDVAAIDQRIDYALNNQGLISSDRRDLNNDGQIDQVTIYTYDSEDRVFRIEEDRGADGVADALTVHIYDDRGLLLRSEIDEGVDGSIDALWTYMYAVALCNTSSNHQPYNYVCVLK